MTTESRPTIVVGVSGSPASAAALQWAADEARNRHAWLKVVRVWTEERRAYYAAPMSAPDRRHRQEQASHDLAVTLHAVLGPVLPDNLTAEVTEGLAERALVAASAGADLLVLGSSDSQFAARSAGPVVRACLSRSHCPVVVVSPETLSDCSPDMPVRLSPNAPIGRTGHELVPAGGGGPAGQEEEIHLPR
jgi:nucleotide-binding universal stress UspA family protein